MGHEITTMLGIRVFVTKQSVARRPAGNQQTKNWLAPYLGKITSHQRRDSSKDTHQILPQSNGDSRATLSSQIGENN
jgi:hypothetical protein